MDKKANKETEIDWLDLKERLKRQSGMFGLQTGTNSLQAQWMRLFSFFQHSTEGMLLLDADGQVLMANRACQHIFDRNQADLLATDVYTLFPLKIAVDREPKVWLKAVAVNGLYSKGDSLRNRKTYALREVSIEADGDEKLIQVYIREVTELARQAEYEAEQTAMFIQMLGHAREPMILLDASLTIFEFNEVAARMMHGITGRYMKKGESYLDFANPGRAKEKGWEIFREVLSGLVVERNIEWPSPIGGNAIHWLLTYQPLYDVYGEMAGVLISGLEQTRERAWQAQLSEQADRLRWWEMRQDAAMCVVDTAFKFKYVGGALGQWLGHAATRLEGTSFGKLLPAKSPVMAELQAWLNAPYEPYTGIWEMLRPDKTTVRLGVTAHFEELAASKEGRLVLHFHLQAPHDQLAAKEHAFAAVLQLNKEQPVMHLLMFDQNGLLINPNNWPPPKLEKATDPPENLLQVLRALGKQPNLLLQKWEATQRAVLSFEVQHADPGLHWQLWEIAAGDDQKMVLLALVDGAAKKRIPVLEKEVLRLHAQLDKRTAEVTAWRTAFGLLERVFSSVSWEYSREKEQFTLLTPGQMLFFGHAGQDIAVRELYSYLHPADAKQFMEEVQSVRDLGVDGWARVRNAHDDFDQWHYRLMPTAAGQPDRGIWYRPFDNGFSLSLEHFLGFSRFLDDIGWGAMVLDQFMRLEHASALAQNWLQLPTDWSLQRFDSLAGVAQTRLAAEVCSMRPPGSLFQFEYFNAFTQRWMFVWIYTTQNIRAVYLQQMKA